MFRFTIIAFLLLSQMYTSIGQVETCGTSLKDANIPYLSMLNKTISSEKSLSKNINISMTFVPVQLHIIRASNGTGGISQTDFMEAFDHLNRLYKDAGIHFFECSGVNYIDNDVYYDLDKSNKAALDATHSVASVINIYSTNTVTSNGSTICGFAEYPGGLDLVVLDNKCTTNGSTLAHEIGHYFALFHTHETFYGAESVDRNDCLTYGDLLCDTPADPRLSTSVVDVLCKYTGTATDSSGISYAPDTDNIMSYSRKECRTIFTEDQLIRIQAILVNYRSYLSCNNSIALESDFYIDFDPSCNDTLSVEFCDITEAEASSWLWDFGDGNTSILQSPVHTYDMDGSYSVSLTTTNSSGTNTATQMSVVSLGAHPVPYFQDFENGVNSLTDFTEMRTLKNFTSVSPNAAKNGTFGLLMEGYPTVASPAFNAFGVSWAFHEDANKYYKSRIETCIDATGSNILKLTFDLKQLFAWNSKYSNFRVLVNENQVGGTYQADGTETWDSISINLNDYANSIFTLAFEGSHKYDMNYQSTNGTATFIDNIELTNVSPSFATTWKTDNSGTSNDNQITIPGIGNYDIYWEQVDSVSNNGTTSASGNHTITFPNSGNYRVEITGGLNQIKFDDNGDKYKLLTIENWGDIAWTSMNSAFEGCTNLTLNATDAPDLSGVTDCYEMFRLCTNFNGIIGHWDVSNIKNMGFMFAFASSFNQGLYNWNVSKVTSMKSMFRNASAFNRNLRIWNVSKVKDMRSMFRGAAAFNRDVENWDVSQVTSMRFMFKNATNFNQDISQWNTEKVDDMSEMFWNANSFNQYLGNWDITQATTLKGMLDSAAISVVNYDSTLTSWSTQNVIPNIIFGASNIKYCNGEAARNVLTTSKNWNIVGDSKECPSIFLSAKIFLEGALFNGSDISNTMNDDLRLSGFIPTKSPYPDSILCSQAILNVTGPNAIVDWVWIELRDGSDSNMLITSRSALLRRDGKIVDLNGTTAVEIDQTFGSYFILINHRNHLAVMSSSAQYFGSATLNYDFTHSISSIFGGANSTRIYPEGFALIAGDVDENGKLQNTDVASFIPHLGSTGYINSDVDMDGQIQISELDSLLTPNIGKAEQY